MSVLFTRRGTPPRYGTLASNLEIGSSVFLNVDGSPKEFIVVHQGNPDSSLYDVSCDGTWLLMKDIYKKCAWHNTNNNSYKSSDIKSYLDNEFVNMFDLSVQGVIKIAKIPYRNGSGYSATASNGVNGLDVKIFLLSASEVGSNYTYMPTEEGVTLSYFSDCTDNERIAYFNNVATSWWLRSPSTLADMGVNLSLYVTEAGKCSNRTCTDTYTGVRPALILQSNNVLFDPNTRELIEVVQ